MDLSDTELLREFLLKKDESHLEEILKRHGPMVLNVCKRMLSNEHDAQEAFQATFIIFAQKASTIQKSTSLTSWLHGVGIRTSIQLRKSIALRKKRESEAAEMIDQTSDSNQWEELRPLLDEEIQALPEKYRVPIISCYLEGKTYQEAAATIGCSYDEVRGRLERARDLLRIRFQKRGIVLSVLGLETLISNHSTASLPLSLANTTKAAVLQIIGGKSTVVATSTLKLAHQVNQGILMGKIKVITATAIIAASATMTGGIVYKNYSNTSQKTPSQTSENVSKANVSKLESKNVDLQKRVHELEDQLKNSQDSKKGSLEKVAELPPIVIPESPGDWGQQLGKLMRKSFELKQRFPKGAPKQDAPEYEDYVRLIDGIFMEFSPIFASAKTTDWKSYDRDPKKILEFANSLFTEGLILNPSQAGTLKSITDKYTALLLSESNQDATVKLFNAKYYKGYKSDLFQLLNEEQKQRFDAVMKSKDDNFTMQLNLFPDVSEQSIKGESDPDAWFAIQDSDPNTDKIIPIETLPVKKGYPYGIKTRWPGLVKSPYAQNKTLVNVEGMKAGNPVRCPHTGKVFVVPE